ncbi:glycosyltransferase family 4 protein [Patescibacteria group bacterium]
MEGKKRVLIFIPEFPKLTETFIEREISKLVERNNLDITVVALGKGRGKVSDNLLDRVHYERITIPICISAAFTYLSKIGQIVKIFKELRDSGKGIIGKIYIFLKSVAYTKIFSEYKPDLVFAHFMAAPSTMAMISARILGVPFAVSAHARDITVEAEYVEEKIRLAKFITICNKNAYNYLLRMSNVDNPSNVHLIYHGVDFEKLLKSVPKVNIRKSVPVLLSVGRFTEKKGYKYLVEASKILRDRKIAHEIKIIAAGPLYKNIQMSIKKYKLEDKIEILGGGQGLPFTKVAKYYRIADAYVFPSIETSNGDMDGVANVLLEAAAFKLPIVATDSGGTTEVIRNNETGVVVPQRDPEKLADGIQVVLQDKDFAKNIGENAYNYVLKRFNLDENIKKLEELIIK